MSTAARRDAEAAVVQVCRQGRGDAGAGAGELLSAALAGGSGGRRPAAKFISKRVVEAAGDPEHPLDRAGVDDKASCVLDPLVGGERAAEWLNISGCGAR